MNMETKKEIDELKEQINSLRKENKYLSDKLISYESETAQTAHVSR